MTQAQFFAQLDSVLTSFGYDSNIFDDRISRAHDESFLDDLVALTATVVADFVTKLDTYQSHYRQADKLDKRTLPEKQQFAKASEKLAVLEEQGASHGHVSAARKQADSAQARIDAILAEKAVVMDAARAYFPTFMAARMAEEAVRMAVTAYSTGDYLKAQERLDQAAHLIPQFGK